MKIYCRKLVAALATVLVAASCSDNLSEDDHYKVPSWLKGNAYEVLQKEGNYTTFLRGIDLTGNSGIVGGKSILTVAAPNDDAFSRYLSEKGYSSIDEMYQKDPQAVKNLIGMHLMYYAYDWNKLVNFRPTDGDAATDEDKAKMAGMYYKHRTHSQDAAEDVNAMIDGVQKDVKIYHYERYLPVFSTKFFQTKGITDAATDYNYFYPNTTWYGSAHGGDGFNIANAAVDDENNVITDNGYLYHIDRVIEPVNTIYDELKNNADYSEFFKLYDSYMQYGEALSETNTSLGYTAYVRNHTPLPDIAHEWTTGNKAGLAYSMTAWLESNGYTIFAPTNAALDNFFRTFWTAESGYPNLDELDPLIKQYFVQQMFAQSDYPVFPAEIKSGKVKTPYGTTVNLNPDDIAQNRRKICENGVLYGMDQMTAPAIFSSVVAPAFRDSKYGCFLYTLDGSGLTSSLAADNTEYVALIPTNDQYLAAEPSMRLYTAVDGKVLQEFNDVDGVYGTMSTSHMTPLVNIHISDNVSSLKNSGIQIVPTYSSFNYWYVKDGKITTNALFNQQLNPAYSGNPFVAFHELKNGNEAWSNGKAYTYDASSVFKSVEGDGLLHSLAVCNDANYEYYLFAQLLNKAGFVSGTDIKFPTDEAGVSRRLLVFVPTNEAIKKAMKENKNSIAGASPLFDANGNYKPTGKLNATQKSQLQSWLQDYFVSNEENQITDYPFIGSSCKGEFITKNLTTKLDIIDNGSSLSVKLAGSNNVVPVDAKYSYFPFAFADGCMHFIDGILK